MVDRSGSPSSKAKAITSFGSVAFLPRVFLGASMMCSRSVFKEATDEKGEVDSGPFG